MRVSSFMLKAACSALAISLMGPQVFAGGGAAVPTDRTDDKKVVFDLEEQTTVLKAAPPDDRRVYITDPADFMLHGRITAIDGNKGKIIAHVDSGFLPIPILSSTGNFFGQISTLWSRVSRGTRNDYLEIYDPQTFLPTTDIDLPPVRFLVNTYPWMVSLTPDDKKLLAYQFSPNPAVSLIDLESKKFVKTMDVPDCYHIFPTANDTFYMHCREGHLLKATFDKDGNIKHEKTKVFHAEDEYLFNQPAYSPKAKRLVWPSYDGTIYQVDFSSGEAKFLEPFEAFTEQEKADKWAPGGWNIVAYHRESNRIFLLADQREQWTHKYPSRFVFVFDAATGKRLNKIEINKEINSIGVSPDKDPQLYALDAHHRTLHIYEANTGKEVSSVDKIGVVPLIVTTLD
jgi:methylamine dehydrogenase heavy chain